MISINKEEKDLLVKAFPPNQYPEYYCYPRTMKNDSKRGHYFCVESDEIVALLNDIRQRNVVEKHGKFD